jgi:hypothetical protein
MFQISRKSQGIAAVEEEYAAFLHEGAAGVRIPREV